MAKRERDQAQRDAPEEEGQHYEFATEMATAAGCGADVTHLMIDQQPSRGRRGGIAGIV